MSNVIDFMKYQKINDIEKLHKDIWRCAKDTMDADSKWISEHCPEYSEDRTPYDYKYILDKED